MQIQDAMGSRWLFKKSCQMNTDLFETLQNTTKAGEGGSEPFCTLIHYVPSYQDDIFFPLLFHAQKFKNILCHRLHNFTVLIYLPHLINPC